MSPSLKINDIQSMVCDATLPVILTDKEGSILYSNPAAVALLGGGKDWLKNQWEQLTPWLQAPIDRRTMKIRIGATKVVPVEAAVTNLEVDQRPSHLFFLYDLREQLLNRRQLSAARDRLKLLSDQLVHAHESERTHFAREIHDGLLQYIIGARLVLDKVRSGGELSLLDLVSQRLEDAITESRRLVGELRPPTLDDFGLEETLAGLLRSQSKASKIEIRFEYNLDESQLPDALKTNIFRLVQEATTNVVRHSQATTATVSLWREDDLLRLQIKDNGKGFDSDFRPGVGMTSMEERANLFGGTLWWESLPQNTLVELSMPWPSQVRIPSESERTLQEILPSFFSRLRSQVEKGKDSPTVDRAHEVEEEELKTLAHELQVYQIELEMQNEELRRGHMMLENERDRYRELFEHAPVGYLSISQEEHLSRANLKARELLELDQSGSGTIKLESIVAPRCRYRIRELLKEGSGQIEVWMKRRRSGTEFRASLELRDFQGEGTSLATICDLTAEDRRSELEEQLTALRLDGNVKDSSEQAGLDLNRELAVLMDSFRGVFPGKKLELRVERALPKVLMDRTALRMIVTNLVKNATDALGSSAGVVTLSSGSFVSGPGEVNSFVSLDVSDTGFSDDFALMNQAVEAFSKSGDERELRLCEVLYLVRLRKGEVHLLSEPGRGTTVRVLLPSHSAQ